MTPPCKRPCCCVSPSLKPHVIVTLPDSTASRVAPSVRMKPCQSKLSRMRSICSGQLSHSCEMVIVVFGNEVGQVDEAHRRNAQELRRSVSPRGRRNGPARRPACRGVREPSELSILLNGFRRSPRCSRRWLDSAGTTRLSAPTWLCLRQPATSNASITPRRACTAACATNLPSCRHRWRRLARFRPRRPALVVVTAAGDALAGWLPLQDRMATLSTNSAIASCLTHMLRSSRNTTPHKRQAGRFATSCIPCGSLYL